MNIFVAGLNYKISEAELGDMFAEYGEIVSVKIVTDRETGRSKGYGFVEMAEDEAGNKAIEALNGVEIDGRTIAVSVARPREEAPRRNNYGGGGGNRGGYGGGNRGGYGGGRY
ncbi:RNA-binding protein [Bacteroides sp. 51]|uniref:RNA recognition motif domain-containing protein n=1 Tax=Bacteroides sp. 51 TaxID=2302938 RepID=UPI0013D4CFC3|nr:RNA-binding protein [Bacteroides sp. 51]NDV82792.1 RNA-binding protein [Bacteroides sp. 51]